MIVIAVRALSAPGPCAALQRAARVVLSSRSVRALRLPPVKVRQPQVQVLGVGSVLHIIAWCCPTQALEVFGGGTPAFSSCVVLFVFAVDHFVSCLLCLPCVADLLRVSLFGVRGD